MNETETKLGRLILAGKRVGVFGKGGALPVLDGDRLVGIITESDIFMPS